MSIMELGALGEFLGSIGVIITLVYLAIQIRANTRAAKASASFDATHSWAQLNEWIAQQPDELMSGLWHCYEPEFDLNALSYGEFFRLTHIHRAIFQKLEGQYFLYKYGLLEKGVWAARSSMARGITNLPAFQTWWRNEVQNLIYSQEFVQAVEGAEPNDPSTINVLK